MAASSSTPPTSSTPPSTTPMTSIPPSTIVRTLTADPRQPGLRKGSKNGKESGPDPQEEREVVQVTIRSLEEEILVLKKKHEAQMVELEQECTARIQSAREIQEDVIMSRVEGGRAIGLKEGYDQGYQAGRKDGWAAGQSEGRTTGFEEGREIGYANGSDNGLQTGLDEGMRKGKIEGRAEGITQGRQEGLRLGLIQGLKLFQSQFMRSPTGQQFLRSASQELSSAYLQSREYFDAMMLPLRDFFIYGFESALKQAHEQGFEGEGNLELAWDMAPPLAGWKGASSHDANWPWWFSSLQRISQEFE